MASNSPLETECSDWLVFGRDFTVRTITMDIFFSRSCSRKIQTAKTQEDKKRKGLELVQNK